MLGSSDLLVVVATTNPASAKVFYGEVLGLRLVSEDSFALVFDANGTTVRVTRVEHAIVPPYTTLGWIVTDIVSTVRELGRRGVAFLRFDGVEQNALGIWTAPGGTKVAWFHDPEGHVLSLSQEPAIPPG